MYRYLLIAFIFITQLTIYTGAAYADETYQTPSAFLAEVFHNNIPSVKKIWLTGEIKKQVTKILRHPPTSLRTRYWHKDQRSVWILSEIGKERPITIGVVINQNRIEKIKVLVFRESRGGEVRHPFFTNQFKHAELSDSAELSRNIDGITGATLSVRALKKMATLALYLHQKIES